MTQPNGTPHRSIRRSSRRSTRHPRRRGIAAAATAGMVAGLLVGLVPAPAEAAGTGTLGTIAGYGSGTIDASTLAIRPSDAVADGAGNTYIADGEGNVVWKVTPLGAATRAVGTGAAFSGPDLTATTTSLSRPLSVALSGNNLFVTEALGNRIRKVNVVTGTVSTIAGTGTAGFAGDGGPAGVAQLNDPRGIAVDSVGHVYVADLGNSRVRRIDAGTGVISTVAGTGTDGYSGDGGTATAAQLNGPQGVAIASDGDLLIADTQNHRIREVSGGTISTFAGTGVGDFSGDGGAATSAALNRPGDVAAVASGQVLISDSNNNRIRRVATGTITTVAGNGSSALSGDGGAATAAGLGETAGIGARASADFVFGAQAGWRVRKVATTTITSVAGNGTLSLGGSGVPATQAQLHNPGTMIQDADGNTYVSDSGNHAVRKISATGTITTIAGNGFFGTAGDGGPATSAQLWSPGGLALDPAGILYIAERSGHRIRQVDLGTGIISTFAGTGTAGFSGDGGPAAAAQLDTPHGLVRLANGDLWVADNNNHRIRKISGGTISTVAGTGSPGNSGDGGPATAAQLQNPTDLAVDSTGAVHIADSSNFTVRKVVAGTITRVAGTGVHGTTGDGGSALTATLSSITGLAFDSADNLVIVTGSRVRRVVGGTIDLVAGGQVGFTADGGAAAPAALLNPEDAVVEPSGRIVFTEASAYRIRTVEGLGSAGLHGVTPLRLLDSRDGTGGFSTPWGAGTTRDLTVTGLGGIPTDATAVALNVTAVGPTAATHLTVWPAGQTMPVASNLNVPAGDVRPNLVVVKVGAGGKVSIFNNSGNVHVIADIVGYYDETGDRYTGISPNRLLDSRDGTGGFATPWGPGVTRELTVAGVGGVPSDATAVALNVTAVGPTAASHLTVWPSGEAMPVASNLNFPAGDVRPNLVLVKVGDLDKVSIFNNSGNVHVIADVVGYASPAAGVGLLGVTPTRLVDSRDGTGGFATPWGPGASRDVTVTGLPVVPGGATAVVLNVTAVGPTASSHLTIWPAGEPKPVASNLNVSPGQVVPNLVMVKVGAGGKISIFNNSGNVHVIVDVVAYYQ